VVKTCSEVGGVRGCTRKSFPSFSIGEDSSEEFVTEDEREMVGIDTRDELS